MKQQRGSGGELKLDLERLPIRSPSRDVERRVRAQCRRRDLGASAFEFGVYRVLALSFTGCALIQLVVWFNLR